MVPKARLDDGLSKERAKTAEANKRADYWEGAAAGFAAGRNAAGGDQQAATPAPAPMTPEQQVTDLRAQQATLAQAYDAGDSSMAEFQTAKDALEDQIHGIRQTVAQQSQQPAAAEVGESLALQQLNTALNDAHPYTQQDVLSRAAWNFIETTALDALAARGMELPRGVQLTEAQQAAFRTEFAVQSDIFGPSLAPDYKVPAAGTQQPATKSSNDPTALAQERARQLAMAQQQPANTNGVGAGGGAVQITEAEFLKLSDDEVNALPEAVVARFA